MERQKSPSKVFGALPTIVRTSNYTPMLKLTSWEPVTARLFPGSFRKKSNTTRVQGGAVPFEASTTQLGIKAWPCANGEMLVTIVQQRGCSQCPGSSKQVLTLATTTGAMRSGVNASR